MACVICGKYEGNYPIQPIAERGGVALSHLAPSDDGLAMRGRLVIEPKRHVVRPEELSDEEFANMSVLLRRAMILLQKSLGAEHVYFFRINDLVPHFHFHVVPRYPNTPREYWGLKLMEWPEYPKIGVEEIRALSSELKSQL